MKKPKKEYACQQVLLDCDKDTRGILEYICSESNKLYNSALYVSRQLFFKKGKYFSKFDLINQMKNNPHYSSIFSQSAQQTCIQVFESVKSYRELKSKSIKGELHFYPQFPNYRETGLNVISYPAQTLKLKDNNIIFPLGNLVNIWFNLKNFSIRFPNNLNFNKLVEVRFLPRNGCFYAEFVTEIEISNNSPDINKVLGIDHGVNNWLTCVSNIGTSFIINGKRLKSVNQWFNKSVAYHQSKIKKGWSKRLESLTEKRNRQMRDAINKAARLVINYCLENSIGVIVFGWNKHNKDSINIGKKNNQNYVQIPTARLRNRIEQMCQYYNIKFIETEESYTSKASFLDSDNIPVYGEKPVSVNFSGKRLVRGLYKTAQNFLINADCNGAANIIKKVKKKLNLDFDLSGINRGVLTAPLRLFV